jgi:hypothetical protein
MTVSVGGSKVLAGLLIVLFTLAVTIGVFVGIPYLIVKNIRNAFRKNSHIESESLHESNSRSIAAINSEKHAYKCYMDGLNESELEVANILAEELSYKDYFIFNNIIIPSELNTSSQIDHLVVSKFGIFVIETKDYKGWIFGSANQENWTQSLPGGRSKFQFQNPIRQNWSHVMSLKKILPFLPENAFQSIVVFTERCEIKTPMENVVLSDVLIASLKKFKEIKISEENLHLVLGKLSYVCQTVDISPSQHVENLLVHHS